MTYSSTIVDKIARSCHEVNRAYCASLGDHSHERWELTPEQIRNSARAGVQAILKNPNLTPEENHESRFKYKEAEGWKYGPVKDITKLEHPCMVSYHELPQEQKAKDAIFGAVVRELRRVYLN